MRRFLGCLWARTRLPRRAAAFIAGICCLLPLVGCAPTPPPGVAQAPVVNSADIVTMDVGGVAVRFAPIPGWCIFPPDLHTEGRQLVEGTMQELVILTSIGDCGQIEAAKASVGSVPDDAYVAATKALLETDLGDDRAGFVRALAAE